MVVDWDFGDVGSVCLSYTEQNIFYAWLLVSVKWTNTNPVGELINENSYQLSLMSLLLALLLVEFWEKS